MVIGIITQIKLTSAVTATGNVIWSSVPGREDATTLVTSLTGSVLKSAFIELLYLYEITCSCDLKASHKPQASFHKRVSSSINQFLSFRVKHPLWQSAFGFVLAMLAKRRRGGISHYKCIPEQLLKVTTSAI